VWSLRVATIGIPAPLSSERSPTDSASSLARSPALSVLMLPSVSGGFGSETGPSPWTNPPYPFPRPPQDQILVARQSDAARPLVEMARTRHFCPAGRDGQLRSMSSLSPSATCATTSPVAGSYSCRAIRASVFASRSSRTRISSSLSAWRWSNPRSWKPCSPQKTTG
jgi:hypothetical protein